MSAANGARTSVGDHTLRTKRDGAAFRAGDTLQFTCANGYTITGMNNEQQLDII